MKRLSIFLAILAIVVALLIIYNPLMRSMWHYLIGFSKVTQIADITKKELITLTKDEREHNVVSRHILILGHIDGSAIIRTYGANQVIEEIKGKVRLRIGGDWYQDKCLIEYEPIDVTSGELRIKYRFKAMSVTK